MKAKILSVLFAVLFFNQININAQDLSNFKLFALEGYQITYSHLDPAENMGPGSKFKPGSIIGTVSIPPEKYSDQWHDKILESQRLYANRQFKKAAEVLEKPLESEQENVFILFNYARALYQTNERETKGFSAYEDLIKVINGYSMSDKDIVVDMWFPEAHWKIGTLYLDQRQYSRAIFEFSRFITYLQTMGVTDRVSENRLILCQVFQYLAEAYYYSYLDKEAMYYSDLVLTIDPENQTVLGIKSKISKK